MENVRSFIAIELNNETRQALSGLIEALKAAGADVKWVRPEHMHLTLKFLGNISKEEIDAVKNILNAAGDRFKAFEMRLAGLGAFPGLSNPGIIWVGVEEGTGAIKEIFDFLETGLTEEGFEKERRSFSPHLTIGRTRSPKNKKALKSLIENTGFSPGKSVTIDRITLFRSALTPQGPIYAPLHEARFSG